MDGRRTVVDLKAEATDNARHGDFFASDISVGFDLLPDPVSGVAYDFASSFQSNSTAGTLVRTVSEVRTRSSRSRQDMPFASFASMRTSRDCYELCTVVAQRRETRRRGTELFQLFEAQLMLDARMLPLLSPSRPCRLTAAGLQVIDELQNLALGVPHEPANLDRGMKSPAFSQRISDRVDTPTSSAARRRVTSWSADAVMDRPPACAFRARPAWLRQMESSLSLRLRVERLQVTDPGCCFLPEVRRQPAKQAAKFFLRAFGLRISARARRSARQ